MRLFIDTANVEHIREINGWGVLEGVTTNPSLACKENRNYRECISEIAGVVSGPVSAEAVSMKADGMIAEARELAAIAENVNVKIPLGVLRAGLKLTSLIPKPATEQINKAMADKGMTFDIGNLKPEDLNELVDSLAEMEIEVDANNGDTVRVYAA